MKQSFRLLLLAFFAAWMITFTGCKKNAEIPTLTTTAVSLITETTVITGGTVTSGGGADVIARGVCWSISHNPTVTDNKTLDGTGSGSFVSNITDLTANTTYHIRAYATNSAGTNYGGEISFSTQDPPAVTTTSIVSYILNAAVVTGNIIYDQNGYLLIGSGVSWSTSHNPTTADSKTMNGTFSGIFTSDLTGLEEGTTYFVRAYAVYDNGPTTVYGNELSFTTSFEQGIGTQKTDFPGGARYLAIGFSIGSKVYLGLGNNDETSFNDFWEWDQTTNLWKKKADYPGTSTNGACGFSIGTKGYIETGINYGNLRLTNEFWEYDPATDTWAEKSSVPGAYARSFAVGFSIGTKGYIGTGYWYDGNSGAYYQDFWEWDQMTNVWTQKADFPGTARASAVGFSIGNKGYLGIGSGEVTPFNDFWEWDQASNVWTRKANFAGTSRLSAAGFSIGNKGYIGTGFNYGTYSNNRKDIWEWDQLTNVWLKKNNLGGDARSGAVGVSIGNKGYIVTGIGGNPFSFLMDLWEYDPTLN